MTCIKKIQKTEIFGSKFSSRTLTTAGDISEYSFKAVVKNIIQGKILEIAGIKNAGTINFDFSQLETLKKSTYMIEYWGDFGTLGNEPFLLEELSIVSAENATNCTNSDNLNFEIKIEEISIPVTITKAINNFSLNIESLSDEQKAQLKGPKGDAFTYADFTPTQISELQKPATDKLEELNALETTLNNAESLRVQNENTRKTSEETRNSNEIDRSSSENSRQENEVSRQENENARILSEMERNDTEIVRISNENTRVTSENTRNTNEQTRINSENNRVSAETSRVNSENTRIASETERVSNENLRKTAENARVSAENTRTTAETSRSNAENTRVTAETERVSSENTRNTNEQTRINAENTRVTAETERVSNENIRKTAETSRTNAETTRVTAENTRVSNESSRVTAENTRVSNESSRVTAENSRVSNESSRVTAESSRVTAENARVAAELERQNNKPFNVKVTTPSSWVTGTLSETEIYRFSIPANTISSQSILSIESMLFNKIGVNGSFQVRVKLTTSSTMPTGSTEQIARSPNINPNVRATAIRKKFYVNGDIIKSHGFDSGLLIDEFNNTDAISSRIIDRTQTYNVIISVTLNNASDQVRLEGLDFNIK